LRSLAAVRIGGFFKRRAPELEKLETGLNRFDQLPEQDLAQYVQMLVAYLTYKSSEEFLPTKAQTEQDHTPQRTLPQSRRYCRRRAVLSSTHCLHLSSLYFSLNFSLKRSRRVSSLISTSTIVVVAYLTVTSTEPLANRFTLSKPSVKGV
jgi:hypothetical protein